MCESGCACVCLAERERWGVTANSRPGEQGTDRGVFHLYSLRVNTNAVRAQAKLVRLRVLDVSDNKLTALPATIGDLNLLVELNVSENVLTSLPPELVSVRERVCVCVLGRARALRSDGELAAGRARERSRYTLFIFVAGKHECCACAGQAGATAGAGCVRQQAELTG